MITAADVSERLGEVPFAPFEIVTSSGVKYLVRHPEMCWVTRRVVYLGLYTANNVKIPHESISISVLHIAALCGVEQAVA